MVSIRQQALSITFAHHFYCPPVEDTKQHQEWVNPGSLGLQRALQIIPCKESKDGAPSIVPGSNSDFVQHHDIARNRS